MGSRMIRRKQYLGSRTTTGGSEYKPPTYIGPINPVAATQAIDDLNAIKAKVERKREEKKKKEKEKKGAGMEFFAGVADFARQKIREKAAAQAKRPDQLSALEAEMLASLIQNGVNPSDAEDVLSKYRESAIQGLSAAYDPMIANTMAQGRDVSNRIKGYYDWAGQQIPGAMQAVDATTNEALTGINRGYDTMAQSLAAIGTRQAELAAQAGVSGPDMAANAALSVTPYAAAGEADRASAVAMQQQLGAASTNYLSNLTGALKGEGAAMMSAAQFKASQKAAELRARKAELASQVEQEVARMSVDQANQQFQNKLAMMGVIGSMQDRRQQERMFNAEMQGKLAEQGMLDPYSDTKGRKNETEMFYSMEKFGVAPDAVVRMDGQEMPFSTMVTSIASDPDIAAQVKRGRKQFDAWLRNNRGLGLTTNELDALMETIRNTSG